MLAATAARHVLIELQHDLIAIVRKSRFVVNLAIAVDVDILLPGPTTFPPLCLGLSAPVMRVVEIRWSTTPFRALVSSAISFDALLAYALSDSFPLDLICDCARPYYQKAM
jgi:hypothetical protein